MAQDPKSEEVHTASKVGKVDLNSLQIDNSYQRIPSPKMVEQIQEDWDLVASELLLVSNRGERNGDDGVEGGLFLVNGQHRSLAARRLGIKSLDARIIDLSEEPDPGAIEAKFRLKTNVGLRDGAMERFKAQLRGGDEESVAIVTIVARAGTEIQFDLQDEGGIVAIASIEQVYRYDHTGGLLQEALEVIRDAFDFQGKALSSAMIKGVAWFISVHYEQADITRLIMKAKDVGSLAIDRKARTIQGVMLGSLWFNYYRELVDVYNEGLQEKTRLEWISKGAKILGGKSGSGTAHQSS